MAGQPSDVLTVALFMKEAANRKTLPVRILFILISLLKYLIKDCSII
jgi:hypothetical protein